MRDIIALGRSFDGFDPRVLMENYSGMSHGEKSARFGRERVHLDRIESVMRRSARWPESIDDPITALRIMFSPEVITAGFSSSAGLASIAQWMKAYERAVRSGGKSRASLRRATRNLDSNLGGSGGLTLA